MTNYRLILISCLLIFSCNAEKELNLNGKWQVKESTIENESLLPHNRLQLTEELNSMVIDLKDDGAIVYSNFYRLGAHGNWNLNQNQDSLTINYQFERAVITDQYQFKMLGEEMHLETTSFEGTKSVSLTLSRSKE